MDLHSIVIHAIGILRHYWHFVHAFIDNANSYAPLLNLIDCCVEGVPGFGVWTAGPKEVRSTFSEKAVHSVLISHMCMQAIWLLNKIAYEMNYWFCFINFWSSQGFYLHQKSPVLRYKMWKLSKLHLQVHIAQLLTRTHLIKSPSFTLFTFLWPNLSNF